MKRLLGIVFALVLTATVSANVSVMKGTGRWSAYGFNAERATFATVGGTDTYYMVLQYTVDATTGAVTLEEVVCLFYWRDGTKKYCALGVFYPMYEFFANRAKALVMVGDEEVWGLAGKLTGAMKSGAVQSLAGQVVMVLNTSVLTDTVSLRASTDAGKPTTTDGALDALVTRLGKQGYEYVGGDIIE